MVEKVYKIEVIEEKWFKFLDYNTVLLWMYFSQTAGFSTVYPSVSFYVKITKFLLGSVSA